MFSFLSVDYVKESVTKYQEARRGNGPSNFHGSGSGSTQSCPERDVQYGSSDIYDVAFFFVDD